MPYWYTCFFVGSIEWFFLIFKKHEIIQSKKAAEKRFQTDCEKLGIDPEQPPKEQLVQSLVNLPSIVQSISESFTQLEPLIDYYMQFLNFTSGEAECLTNLKVRVFFFVLEKTS